MEHARQFYIDGARVDPTTPKLLDVAGVREFGAWELDEFLDTKPVVGFKAA